MIPRFPDPSLSHWQTHPQEGGESLAVVSDSKVVWFGSKDFHDVLIEFGLLDLKEENMNYISRQHRYVSKVLLTEKSPKL